MSSLLSQMIPAIDSVMADGDFVPLEGPLAVGGVTFDVPRAYVSGPGFLELVVIVDLTEGTDHQVRHAYWLVERIASALDQVRSPRTLTAVVLHNPNSARVPTEDFLRHGRVLLVTDAARVATELAPILPIVLKSNSDLTGDPLADLLPKRASGADSLKKTNLIEAAQIGAENVESALVEWIDGAFNDGRRPHG